MNEKQTWNNIAEIYNDKFMSMGIYDASYDKLCSLLNDNASILELGCGPGVITKYLKNKRPDFTILATDYAPNMVVLAKKNVPTAEFKVLDAKQLDSTLGNFNGIVAGFILPFFTKEEVKSLFQTCSDLLSDNGSFYFSFVEGNSEDSCIKKGSNGNELFFRYFEKAFIENTLKSAGFELIDEFKIDFPRSESENEIHTAVIVRKK